MTGDEFVPPRGACDCHVHVIGPKAVFPLAAARSYTPIDAPADALRQMMGRLKLDRAVVVQPSIYGRDNRATLDAVARLGDRGRAVAVIAEDTAGAELDALHRQGVRGLRLNVVSMKGESRDAVSASIARVAALCARNGWHIQFFMPAAYIPPLCAQLKNLPVDVVFDHFGNIGCETADGEEARALYELLGSGRAWVKLSGTYRVATDPFEPGLAALARRFAAQNPERVVWASDWPHTPAHSGTAIEGDAELPYRAIDTQRLLSMVGDWFESRQVQRLLVENPAQLYGFPADQLAD